MPIATGNYTFTVNAVDVAGSSVSRSYSVVVNPAVSITATTLPNGTANVVYNQTIPGAGGTGSLTFYTISGALPTGLTLSSNGVISGTPTVTGNYAFSVAASDTVGANAGQNYTVIVYPAATMMVVSAPPTATAGLPFSITVTATDGAGDTAGAFNGRITLSSTAGADITPTNVLLTNGTATLPITLTAAGSQTLTAAYASLTSGTAPVTVSPGPFTQYKVTPLVSGSTVTAGTPLFVSIQATDQLGNPVSSYSGPASVTVSISPTSSASSFPTTVSLDSAGLGYALGTLDKVGAYTITAASGPYTGNATKPVTVAPSAPVSLAFSSQPVNTPTGVTLPAVSVQILDMFGNVVTSDNSDSVTVSVASGAGSFLAGSTTTALAHNGVATFVNLMLAVPGTYTLAAAVPQALGGPNSKAFSVAPLQVLPGSLLGTPSGFSLQFNAPFLVNSTTPVLYGHGFGTTGVMPSVTLTQTRDGSGNVVKSSIVGSLVLDTANNRLTFVATDTTLQRDSGSPSLPDGTYTVDVSSTALTNGFQAINRGGGFLDGRGAGTPGSGDFIGTFTVNAAAAHDDIVWVPATADGPLQSLNAPGNNQQTLFAGGYPLYINDTTGTVTSVNITFNYNPTLLTVTGATSNGMLAGSSFTLLSSSTPGHALLHYTGTMTNAAQLMGGEMPLGFLTATVPNSSTATPIYHGKDLLHLSALSINGGAISVVGCDALHLVAYVGDGDGNGAYSSNDAVLITRALLSTDSGFSAYPLVDPVIVADTDGDGFISADAALQANEAGVGFPTANLPIPPIAAGANTTPIGNNVDPALTLPSTLQVLADGTVRVPVNIDDAHPQGSTGLIRAELALTYDPKLFTASATDINPGSLLAGKGWSITPSVDQATGQIGIALSGTTPITIPIGGSLITIDFHPTDAISGSVAFELVASARPNGQYVATELEDAQGTFTLSPAPTNGFDPRIDGVVKLAPSLAAAPGSMPGEETETVVSAVAEDVQRADGRYTQKTAILESAVPNADTASIEGSEWEAPAAPTAAAANVSAAAHAMKTAASSSFALMIAGASASTLGGLAFEVGGASMGLQISASQRLNDQILLALGRWISSPADTLHPSTVGDPFMGLLSRQLLPVLPTPDSVGNVNWDELSGDLDLHDAGDLLNRRPDDAPAHWLLLPATGSQVVADQATLDQYFSQIAMPRTPRRTNRRLESFRVEDDAG
jgi:hypothetical protein